MMHTDCQYEDARRIVYEGGACFVPVCMTCHRFVKADVSVRTGEGGLSPEPNATCTKCGRTHMHFEGFFND